MAIAHVVTRGYGNGTLVGSIPFVVTRGYIAGEAGAVPARRAKRRYILPDGRRFYGTPDELRAYIAQLPPHVYATESEKPRRKYAKPPPLELAPDFDPPAAPYRLTPDDVSAARLRTAAERALEERIRMEARAQAEEDEAIALLLTTTI